MFLRKNTNGEKLINRNMAKKRKSDFVPDIPGLIFIVLATIDLIL